MPTNVPGHADRFTLIAAVLILAWAAIMFTAPIGEGDFFWHVKTGEWIWQNKTLPGADPFSFTVKDFNPFRPESGRIPFLLKQYWLGQLALYGIWKTAGEAGMVIFRSVCFTGILWFLYRWTQKYRQGIVPLLAVIVAANVLRNYSAERPQLFGFILMSALVFVLERIRAYRYQDLHWPALALPLFMLIWSNCHGSFILGIVIIVLYATGHLIDRIRHRGELNVFSLATMGGAILVTLINPNGYGAFREFFSVSKSYTGLVSELISPIMLAYKFSAIDYYYWGLVITALVTVIIRCRQMATAHLLAICALLGLSLTGTRYIPFFVLIVPLVCCYLPELRPRRANIFISLMPLLLIGIVIATADYSNVLKFRAERSFPAEASRFLNEINPKGNMFNYIGWGGYLMCYSRYPVFIDGRTLVEEHFPLHNSVLAGRDWQAILDSYGINFMIIPGTDAISLQAYPLLLQLLGENNWALIYKDEVALILLRNSPENLEIIMRYGIDKANLSAHIQDRWKWQMAHDY